MDVAFGHRAMDGPFGRPRPKAFGAQEISGNGGGFLWFVSFGGKRNEHVLEANNFWLFRFLAL